MSNQGYAKPIRIFHSVFALCMLMQLAVGNLMDVPEVEGKHASSSIIPAAIAHESHGASMGPVEESLGFEVHEILGLTIAGLVLLRLLLAMTSLPGAGWRDLFPWLLADGRSRLFKEFKAQASGWLSLKLAPPEEGETIARTVHGLMILLATLMGISGTRLFFGWSITAPQTAAVEAIAEIHETAVVGLEILIAVHILAVILHQMQGHNILDKIKPSK
jgi:cytochrome b561